MNPQHARLLAAAIEYDRGDARRIQHFVKVHDLAAAIGALEGLDTHAQFVLETAAILHDIGIHQAEVVHHNGHGKYQEIEGPIVAAHHHTYDGVNGADWQILLEADFLVNAYEGSKAAAVPGMREKLFRTKTGRAFLDAMFDPTAYNPPANLP